MSSEPSDPPPQRLLDLEARFAWLERHVIEQDRVILELGEEIRRLKREAQTLRERLQASAEPDSSVDADERPPHY